MVGYGYVRQVAAVVGPQVAETDNAVLPTPADFVNAKLSAKLIRQLQDPLTLCRLPRAPERLTDHLARRRPWLIATARAPAGAGRGGSH